MPNYVIKTKSGLYEVQVSSTWFGKEEWSILLNDRKHPIVDVWTGDIDSRPFSHKLTPGAQIVFEKVPGKGNIIEGKHPSKWTNASITDPIVAVHIEK